MQFVHQALAWGFLLALLPPIIHLINLLRRRRIRWAAMDFLKQSYKQHRTWIWLKQWLLLLTRMAVIALAVAMLAQWVSRQDWLAIFGSSVTHHYILLDDSYSMSERVGATTAFDQAEQAIRQIAAQAMAQETPQKFTLLRFSRAAMGLPQASKQASQIDQIADLHAEVVDTSFDLRLEERRRQLEVTELAVGPRPTLEVLAELLRLGSDETSVVYVLSDFRNTPWGQPAELRPLLQEIRRASEAIHFIRCAKVPQGNLAITDVRPGDDTRAAGVPLFVHVTVKNFGQEPARRVPLNVRTVAYDPQLAASSEPGRQAGKADEPPTSLIEEIPPGGTVTQRFQVFFPFPGEHTIDAYLGDDAVAIDNHRWSVLDLPPSEPALIIDGNVEQRNAYYAAAAFSPGQRAQSGIRPDVQSAAFLRDVAPEDLKNFRTLYLLNINRLDDRAVENLERFVRDGGGLAMFLGDQTNLAFFKDRLWRGGQGVFPLPLDREDQLPPRAIENTPDFTVEDHPIFQAFLGERNPFIRLVTVSRYWRPPQGWKPAADSTIRILARLRNQQPLAVEQQFGAGRVMVFLTTLAPEWNNWALDPSFVVLMLRLQSHLAAPGLRNPSQLVGAPLRFELDTRKFRKDVTFVKPGGVPDRPTLIERTAGRTNPDSPLAVALLGDPAAELTQARETQRSGIYEAWPATLEGPFQVHRFAFNVDPAEGDLAMASTESLLKKLEPVKVVVRYADEYARDVLEQRGYNRSLLLMSLLIVLLLGEQVLAYSASYHPAKQPTASPA